MEKKDEKINDNNAEPELFDMVVECVSDQSEISQGEKIFEVDPVTHIEDFNKPSTSSFGTSVTEKPQRRKKIKRIIYIEEESESSDLENSVHSHDSNDSIQKITIIKKICPKGQKECLNIENNLRIPDILNSIEEKIQIPLTENVETPVIYMQKAKPHLSRNDVAIQCHTRDATSNPKNVSQNHTDEIIRGDINVTKEDSSDSNYGSSFCIEENDISDFLSQSVVEILKNRSVAFKVGVVRFGNLKGEEFALEVFGVTQTVFEEWQRSNAASLRAFYSQGLFDYERDLFVSVTEDLFDGNFVSIKDLRSRGNGLRSFHMVNDAEKGLTKEWAVKWCQTFEIGFEKDPLDYLQDLDDISLAFPGIQNKDFYERNQNGTLFKGDEPISLDRDMPILEKVSSYSEGNISPSDSCVPLSPVSLDHNTIEKENNPKTYTCSRSLLFSPKKTPSLSEVNNNVKTVKEESNSVDKLCSEPGYSEEIKKTDLFRQSVVAYAHENGAKSASTTFKVTEDEVKQWCWSGRYRNRTLIVQTKEKGISIPALSLVAELSSQENLPVNTSESRNNSLSSVTQVEATDDIVKNQTFCVNEKLTPLSMGLITTRSQQKSQESRLDTESSAHSSRSTMRTRNSTRKLDQNSSPNHHSSSPSSRNSSPPTRRRGGSPSSNDYIPPSSFKRDETFQMRLTRQTKTLWNKSDLDKPSTSTSNDYASKNSGKILNKSNKMKNLIPQTFGYVPTEYSMLEGISNSVVSSYSLRSKRISKSSDGSRKVVLRKSERQNDLVKSAFTLRQKVVEYARLNGVSAAADSFKLDVSKVKHWSMQSTVQNICQSRLRMSTRGGTNSIFPGPKMIQGQGDTEKMPVFDNYPACFQKRAILLSESKGKDEAAKQFGIPQSVLTEWLACKESVLTLSKVENVVEWEVDLFIEIHKARLVGVGMTLEELVSKGNTFLKSKSPRNAPKLGDDWAFDFCERFGVTLKEEMSDAENESNNETGILNNVGLQRLSISKTSQNTYSSKGVCEEITVFNDDPSMKEENAAKKLPKIKKNIPNGLVKKTECGQQPQKLTNSFLNKVKMEPKTSETMEKIERPTGKLVVTIKKEPTEDDKYSIVPPPKVHSTRSSTQNSTRTNYARLNSGREHSPLFRSAKKRLSTSDASLDEAIEEPPKKKLLNLKSGRKLTSRIKPKSFYEKQYVQGSKRFYSTDFKNSVLEYSDKHGIYSAANHFKICSSMITYWDVSSKITRRNKPGLSYCSSVKNDVLEFVKTGSCYDAAIKYRVSPAVVFKWKAEQKKNEEHSPNNLALQALNQQMLEWYKDSKLKGNSLRKSIIMSKARSLSSQLNYLEFKADEEWYKDWMKVYVDGEENPDASVERRKSNRKPVPKVHNPNIIYMPTKRKKADKPKFETRRYASSRNPSGDTIDDSDSQDTLSFTKRLRKKSEESDDDGSDIVQNSCDSRETNQVWLCKKAENFSVLKKRMTCPSSPNDYSDSNGTDHSANYSTDFKLIVASFALASDIQEAAKKFDLDPELVKDWCGKREDFEKAVNPYFKKPEPSKTVVGFFLKWFREINIQSKVVSAHKVLHKVDQIVQKFGGKKNLNSSKWFYKWYDERLEKIRHFAECDIYQMEDHIDSGSRIRYPAAFKLEFLKYVDRKGPVEACQAFQVSRHLHSHWRKKKTILEMLCQSGKSECNRFFSNTLINNDSTEPSDNEEVAPSTADPDFDVHEWYKKYVSDNGGPPKFDVLRRKAIEIYEKHDVEMGSPSTWYSQFCRTFKISEKFVGDPEMLEFVLKQFDQNVTLSQRDLLNNAIDIIRQKKPNFVGSSGWVHRFIRRYPHLVQEVPSVSEMLPASLETCVTNFRKTMKEIQNEGLFLPLAIGSMDEVPLSFPKINISGPFRPTVRDCGDKHASGVVLLSCLSDGRILPPLIILKRDSDQEEVDHCSNRLIIYQKDIQVDSDMIIKWLKDVWLCHVPIPNLLVLDYYYPHTSPAVQQFTSESGIRLVIVPGGCSAKLHPVATGIRRRFEYLIREQWLRHQSKSYKYIVPSAELILEWVTSAHQQLLTETELAKRSFLVTGITSVDDENQDHLVGDESYLFANGKPFL